MKKEDKDVKVKIVPLLCWDIYFDYLETKFGNRKDDYFRPRKKRRPNWDKLV
jgi:hypothetical protein